MLISREAGPLSRTLLCRVTIFVLPAIAVCAIGGTAAACERCRTLGTTAFHDSSLGGDNENDALLFPPDEEGGSAGFVTTGGKWPQPGTCGSNCRGTPLTITYSYQNMFDGELLMPNDQPLPNQLIRKSIEEALGLWASVAPLHFVEVPDQGGPASFSNYSAGQFGQIRFKQLYINGPDPAPPQDPIAKAMAYYPNSGGNRAGDVFFDNGDRWQEVGIQRHPDILGAAIHEIGHTLGLGHSSIAGVNMYWIFHRFSGLGSGQLFQDDINGIQFIYGAGVGSVTPLPRAAIPEPASSLLIFIATLALANARRRPLHDRLPIAPA